MVALDHLAHLIIDRIRFLRLGEITTLEARYLLILPAQHASAFHFFANGFSEVFSISVDRCNDYRLLPDSIFLHRIHYQRSEGVRSSVALPNDAKILNLVERRLVPLAVVMFDNLEQLGYVFLTVNFFELGTSQYSGINEHPERMPTLYGAVLFRITGNHQPAASIADKAQKPGKVSIVQSASLVTPNDSAGRRGLKSRLVP